jgi:hypothetical protein
MDQWLSDEIKELLFTPCLSISGMIGQKLDNRRRLGQEMDERALTELLVDSLDTCSTENVWSNVIGLLRDQQISLATHVAKSTREHITGADIGFTINRSIRTTRMTSSTTYAVLVQCKRIDSDGNVADFFHEVAGSKQKQSTLMLDITPSSFYFLFIPPSLVEIYCTVEPMAFCQAQPGCSCAVWNIGSFAYSHQSMPFLSVQQKAQAVGVLVVPALAVEAQRNRGKSAAIQDILPNCMPLWYWFGELLIPAFIGDRRSDVIRIAQSGDNRKRENLESDISVRYSVNVSVSNE